MALLGRRELLEALAELDEELKILNVRGGIHRWWRSDGDCV